MVCFSKAEHDFIRQNFDSTKPQVTSELNEYVSHSEVLKEPVPNLGIYRIFKKQISKKGIHLFMDVYFKKVREWDGHFRTSHSISLLLF